jgi:hypothetical protein
LADDWHGNHHGDAGVFVNPSAGELARLIPVRYVSPTGAELVDLAILTDGRNSANLTVAHLWHSTGPRCVGLYVVVSPGRLNGTAVFSEERAFDANLVIRIRVKGGCSDRVLNAGQVEDYVLASDFTYDDLRFFTPRPVLHANFIERDNSASSFILSSTYNWRRTRIHARVHVASDGLVTSIDWMRPLDGTLLRQFAIFDPIEIACHKVPQRISIVRPQESFASELTLRAARCDFPRHYFGSIFDGDLSSACDLLPEVLDRIFEGASPGSVHVK